MSNQVKRLQTRKQERKIAKHEKKEQRINYFKKRNNTGAGHQSQQQERKARPNINKSKPNTERKDDKKSGKLAMKLAIKMEDKIIKQMERKLNLNKRRKKTNTLPKIFYDQGFGEILDFIDKRVDADADLRESKNNEGPEEDDAVGSEDDEMSDEEEDEDGMDDEMEDSAEDGDLEEGSEDEEYDSLKTDLYGNPLDKKGRPIQSMSEPSILQKEQELDKDLLRKIRGQLNRLTSSNLPGISSFIEGFYKSNPRYQVNQSICQCIHDLIVIDVTLSPLKLVCELTLLLCVLHENIGEEVGGHAIHFFVKVFNDLFEKRKETKDEDKRLDNSLSILCYLYAEHLIDVGLFAEIVSFIIQDFSDKSVELLMFILTTTGFVMRKDSPDSLKNIITQIQRKSEERTSKKDESLEPNKRIDFMLETLTAIKNNNMLKVTSKSAGFVQPIDPEQLKNTLKGSLKKSNKVTPIAGSLKQVLSSNRWWIKVGSLLENQTKEERDQNRKKDSSDGIPGETFTNNEEKLCRSLRLNTTPLRRSLFKALLTSSDFIEAADRLGSLCKKTQMMEAAYVLLQVSIHERNFNPFYVVVAKRLGSFDRKYKLAIFFAIRDRLSEVESMKVNKRKVFATLIFHLVKEKVISLSVLKVFDFSDMSEARMTFMKEILELIMSEEDSIMKEIFDRIPKKDHQFASSIRLFISCFMENSGSENMTRDLLKAKIKLGRQLSL
jgi:nucleolar MIF4G domain-containing protein 1